MIKYEYKLLKFRFVSKVSNKLNIPKNEFELNTLGEKGYRLVEIHGLYKEMFFYMEKAIDDTLDDKNVKEMEKYEYRIEEMEVKNRMSYTPNAKANETLLTGSGMEGWRYKKIFTIASYLNYYLLERKVNNAKDFL